VQSLLDVLPGTDNRLSIDIEPFVIANAYIPPVGDGGEHVVAVELGQVEKATDFI